MTKYKVYYQKMVSDNQKAFNKFRVLHDKYANHPDKLQEKYNEEGEKILEIVREYENRLCTNTERGIYNKFSAGLAEKFQNEVRKHFPFIDHVGLKPQIQKFFIKKIDLN
jgi:dihydroorotase